VQDEVNQEESEQNNVDGMKKGAVNSLLRCVWSGTRLYVLIESLGRCTNGAEDSKTLLCRRQWIAVESKDSCFLGKLKFCRIV